MRRFSGFTARHLFANKIRPRRQQQQPDHSKWDACFTQNSPKTKKPFTAYSGFGPHSSAVVDDAMARTTKKYRTRHSIGKIIFNIWPNGFCCEIPRSRRQTLLLFNCVPNLNGSMRCARASHQMERIARARHG